MSTKTKIGPISDGEGYSTGKTIKNHSYEVSNDGESLALMNFLDKNTSVEWGNKLMVNKQGTKVNLLMTSHEFDTITFGILQTRPYFDKGFQVIRDDHIHPGTSKMHQEPSVGDKKVGIDILKKSPKATFRILNQGKYYNYIPK